MEDRTKLISNNDFLSVYYHYREVNQNGNELYYRLYGLSNKTYRWENVSEHGIYFTELGDVYDYVNNLTDKDYDKINIIEYNSETNTDKLYDSIILNRKSIGLKRIKK